MKIKSVFLYCGAGLLAIAMCWGYGCGSGESPSAKPKQLIPTTVNPSPEQFLSQQKGKVVVLLAGMEGCRNTGMATKVLAEMAKDCPNDVVFARLDVPPPEGSIKPVTDWNYPYTYLFDKDRAVANRLGFFYYPTLYVLDRDGEVRYSGGCEMEKLKTMIAEIRAKTPGAIKKIYTPPLPAIGSLAAGFTGKSIKGEEIDLNKFPDTGPTLLFFTSATCPFSREATRSLPTLENEFKDKNVTIITIEKETNPATNKLYQEITLSGPIVWDENGAISRKYGVEPVPFYFVINQAGEIADRGPYTESAARQSLQATLGLKTGGTGDKQPKGAG